MARIFEVFLGYHLGVLILSLSYKAGQEGNWSGVLGHKNPFSFAMDLIAILLYLQSIRFPKYKWLFLGIAGIAIFCVKKADSGMGKVLFIVLISLLIFLRFIKRLPPRLAFASMGVFLAVGVSLAILITENAEYIIVEKLNKDMTLTGRTLIWAVVVPAINRQPLLGYGYQGFWQPWRGADNPAIYIRTPDGYIPPHSHNGFLDTGLDLGWLGLAIFIFSLLTSVYYGVLYLTRSQKPEAVLPLVILTWLVMTNITETGINNISTAWIFYVIMTTNLSKEALQKKINSDSKLTEYI